MKLLVKVDIPEMLPLLVNLPEVAAISIPRGWPLAQQKESISLLHKMGKEAFVDMGFLWLEDELAEIRKYLKSVQNWHLDALLYTDLALWSLAKEYGLQDLLFYDGGSLLTNSVDTYYYRQRNRGVILARELTFEEIRRILRVNQNKASLFIAGYMTMAISRRHFLQAYFAYRQQETTMHQTFYLQEEKRKQRFPIREDIQGSIIYTDSVYLPYEELPVLAKECAYGMFDTVLLKKEEVLQIIHDLGSIHQNNAAMKLAAIRQQFPERQFDTGYLYRKTNVYK